MEITEDYCSYEISKLLKEKGFDEYCFALYDFNKILIQSGIRLNNIQVGRVEGSYSAPTHQMAMKWLREEKNIFLDISMLPSGDMYTVSIWKDGDYLGRPNNNRGETYEFIVAFGIKYSLEKLI